MGMVALLFFSCAKEGDTINNYTTSGDGGKRPNRSMLKIFGNVDSSATIRFNFRNNEIGKLQEFIAFDNTGQPNLKMIFLFNGSGQPVGFQTYKQPINTLEAQGTFKLDKQGRIISVVQRKTNGDTSGIASFQYGENVEYQPIVYSYYDKTADKITVNEFYTYDKDGNMTKSVRYVTDNLNPTYKAEETEATGFGKGINGLNQLYYYLVANSYNTGFSSSSILYFSNYLPTSVRSQSYKSDGSNQSVYISNLELELDNNDNVVLIGGMGSSPIFLKY